MKNYLIKTERLGLRNWLASDTTPFVTMGQDPKVMQYFPELLTEKDWLSFKQALENQPSDIMLWEKEPRNEIRLILTELGLKTVVFNPAGNNSENIDFSILMEQNVLALENYITSKPD